MLVDKILVILLILLHVLCQSVYWLMPGLTGWHFFILFIVGVFVPFLVVKFAFQEKAE